MTPLAVLLSAALAAGPSGQPRRTGLDVSNAARAKAGLLPRKPARAQPDARGRFATMRAPAPTYLPEPAPLAESAPAVDGDADATPEIATADADASRPATPELVVARGPVETRRLPDTASLPRVVRDGDAAVAAPAPISAPDEIDAMRAEAAGVVAEVTISMRFDP